jgi:hypothetical protein
LGGSKGVWFTIESYGKVKISYINVDNRDINFVTMIGHHMRSNFAFSRCLPFSKWLPKHGIKKSVVKIQHFPISSKFDMWVDNDVPTLKNFYWSPFSKWPPQYRKNSTLSDIITI